MFIELQKIVRKLIELVNRYPEEVCVRPSSFKHLRRNVVCDNSFEFARVAFQSVTDKFYFLLFGAITINLALHKRVQADLIVVRSVNGAVGVGLLAEIKRSALVAWLWSRPWISAYKGLVDEVAYRCATLAHPMLDMRDWIRSESLWSQLRRQSGPLSLKVNNIEVADLLVDSYLRYKPAPEFDVNDPFVRRLVWQSLRDVRQAQGYFERIKPHWYLTSYTTYLEHGIHARVAVQNRVNVWAFGSLNCFGKKLKQTDTFAPPDFSGYRMAFDSLDQKQEKLEAARQQLEVRLSGGIDAATSYMRQSAYGWADVELSEDLSQAAVIFLHDFYDSPHVYPDLVFNDFWQWACCTIEFLQSSGTNFYIKPHPNQIALSDKALTRLKKKYPGLKWLPVGVSNVQLARAGIACGITVYGTVAHELAYLGVPSIACARHPHHAFDFCRTARTRAEYEDMLNSYELLPVCKDELQQQALEFYYMHNLYGDDDQLALRQAFVNFWKACNVGEVNEDAVMQSLGGLISLPAFERFIQGMVRTSEEENASVR